MQQQLSEQQISNLETQVCSVTTTTTTTSTTITTTTTSTSITTTTITIIITITITTITIIITITTTIIVITTTTIMVLTTTILLYTLPFKTLSTDKVSRFRGCVPVTGSLIKSFAIMHLPYCLGGGGGKQVWLRILTFFLEDLCQKPLPRDDMSSS